MAKVKKPVTVERRKGKTPNGGVASVCYYRDDEGRPVDKSLATRMEIHELDDDGNSIHRVYAHKG